MSKATDRIIKRIYEYENQIGRFEAQEIKDEVTIKCEKCEKINEFDYFVALRKKCVDPELEKQLVEAYGYFKDDDKVKLYDETFDLHCDDLLDFAYAHQYQDFYNYLIKNFNAIFKNIKNHIVTGENFWTNDFQVVCHFDRKKSDMSKELVEDYLDELIKRGKIHSYKCIIDNENALEFYIDEDDIAF